VTKVFVTNYFGLFGDKFFWFSIFFLLVGGEAVARGYGAKLGEEGGGVEVGGGGGGGRRRGAG